MIELSGQRLSLEQIAEVARGAEHVAFAPAARERVEASRRVVEKITEEGRIVYGVNTGFGKLADITIAPSELRELQLNLVRSHACGVGLMARRGEKDLQMQLPFGIFLGIGSIFALLIGSRIISWYASQF